MGVGPGQDRRSEGHPGGQSRVGYRCVGDESKRQNADRDDGSVITLGDVAATNGASLHGVPRSVGSVAASFDMGFVVAEVDMAGLAPYPSPNDRSFRTGVSMISRSRRFAVARYEPAAPDAVRRHAAVLHRRDRTAS